jgi:hypothetical protein
MKEKGKKNRFQRQNKPTLLVIRFRLGEGIRGDGELSDSTGRIIE